jgi:hypothetical protein
MTFDETTVRRIAAALHKVGDAMLLLEKKAKFNSPYILELAPDPNVHRVEIEELEARILSDMEYVHEGPRCRNCSRFEADEGDYYCVRYEDLKIELVSDEGYCPHHNQGGA